MEMLRTFTLFVNRYFKSRFGIGKYVGFGHSWGTPYRREMLLVIVIRCLNFAICNML